MKFLPQMLLGLAMVTGCASNQPTQPVAEESPDVLSKGGLKYSDAHKQISQLRVFTPEGKVLELFGTPTSKDYFIGGTQTDQPWDGAYWYYNWQFQHGSASLKLMFQRPANSNSALLRDFSWFYKGTIPEVPRD